MSNINIDYNRGVLKKIEPKTHVAVYMYKDTPGVFLNAFGSEVSPELARACGFEVDKLLKLKLKGERMAHAMALIEQEMSSEATKREIVETRDEFRVIHIGLDRYIVEDPDGNNLTPSPLPLDTASKLLVQLTPNHEEEPTKQPPVIWTKKDETEEKEVVQPVTPKVSKKKT